jgi:hypothetical protein
LGEEASDSAFAQSTEAASQWRLQMTSPRTSMSRSAENPEPRSSPVSRLYIEVVRHALASHEDKALGSAEDGNALAARLAQAGAEARLGALEARFGALIAQVPPADARLSPDSRLASGPDNDVDREDVADDFQRRLSALQTTVQALESRKRPEPLVQQS